MSDTVARWLTQAVAHYTNQAQTRSDVLSALGRFNTLRPKTDVYTYDDGRTELLLCIHGLLPISYRGASYHIPIALWIPRDHPRTPPIAYVVPTNDMLVRTSPHLEHSGRCSIGYQDDWQRKPEGCSISALLDALNQVFSREPPVYARPKDPQPAVVAAPPALDRTTAQPTGDTRPILPAKPASGVGILSGALSPPASTSTPIPGYADPFKPPPPVPGQRSVNPPPFYPSTQGLHSPATTPNFGLGNPNKPPPPPPTGAAQSSRYPANFGHQASQSPPPRAESLPLRAPSVIGGPHPSGSASPGPYSGYATPPPPNFAGQTYYKPPPPIPTPAPATVHAPAYSSPAPHLPIPTPNLLDEDDAVGPSSGLAPPQVGPVRPPNPELLALHARVHAKLSSELASLEQALALDAERLRAHQSDLLAGGPAVRDEQGRLSAVRDVCRTVTTRYKTAVDVAERNIGELKRKGDPSVDELVCATTIVHNQLIDLVAEDNAIEDTMYHLHRALNTGRLDLDKFLRTTRALAEEQFTKRALVEKIQQGLGIAPVLPSLSSGGRT